MISIYINIIIVKVINNRTFTMPCILIVIQNLLITNRSGV